MFDRRLGPVAVVCLVLAVVGVAGASQELSGPTRQRTSGFGTDAAAQQSAAIQGTAVIRGRVLSADANAPLRKARVRLSSSSEPNVSRTVVTDNNGYCSFTRVSPGRSSLNASKGGFVPVNYGQARPLGPGHPLELADRQVIEKVDFLLPRGGAISGRVVDEFGEPVSDLQVRAFKRSYFRDRDDWCRPAGLARPTTPASSASGACHPEGTLSGPFSPSPQTATTGSSIPQRSAPERPTAPLRLTTW